MACNDPAVAIKVEATCSLCNEFYRDPVTIDCGHNFCNTCLTKYMNEQDLEIACPECKKFFDHSNLIKNKRLKNIAENAALLKDSENPIDAGLCEEHGEKLQLFCEVDQRVICLVCRESSHHQEHQLRPIREAETAYKDKVQGVLSSIREEIAGIWNTRDTEEEVFKDLQKKLNDEEQNIISTFEELQLVLKDAKEEQTRRLHEMKKYLKAAEQKHTDKRMRETLTLNNKTTEIEVILRLSTVDFLQAVSSTLMRYGYVKPLEPERTAMIHEHVSGNNEDHRNGGRCYTTDMYHEAEETTQDQEGKIQGLSPRDSQMEIRQMLHDGHKLLKSRIKETQIELGKHLEETQEGMKEIVTVGAIQLTTTGRQVESAAQEHSATESLRRENVGSPVSGESLGIAVGEVAAAAATQLVSPFLTKVVAKLFKK
ncbi:hypothetical protein NDU88_006502 [Pleurodeles waltl]|uniref:Uncharacterized protein n=1 Tax=Pleurodeles waltl TaxID=8319 RepID=A0AAV7TX12_PLEWA|nr:hypothetical protein NDU88_006502 [Pleurodeles waltl]